MKHLQTKLNIDGTVCIDYYDNDLYSANTADTIKKSVTYIKNLMGREIRRYPFSVTKCKNCGIAVITNRDYLDEIKCQNCGKTFLQIPVRNEINQALLRKVHSELCYHLKEAVGLSVYMLIILGKDVTQSILEPVLKNFGFHGEHCTGNIYELLLREGRDRGWITAESKVAFCSTQLGENDCLFDETIPRVEACARVFTRLSENRIRTISTHVKSREEKKSSEYMEREQIRRRIERLTAEGRLEKAMQLMSTLG